MRNTKSIFAAIIIAIFALTSCQKENMSELSQNAIPTQNRTTSEVKAVNTAIKTQFTERIKHTQATSRSGDDVELTCSSGTITGSTANSDNYFDAINSPCLGENTDFFDGPDKSYSFLVTNTQGGSSRLNIILTKMQQDLDLFIYALNSQGQISECVATSITHGLEEETLELGGLAPGYYIAVVDGWHADIQSTFELTIFCSSSQEVPENETNTLVNKVVVGLDRNTAIGTFHQVSATEWIFISAVAGETATATEISRDNFNIYLQFDDEQFKIDDEIVTFQLNLNSKEIIVTFGEKAESYGYILDTSEKISGYLANTITLGKDGQTIGKFYRQFNITDNQEEWANGGQTDYFNTLSKDENNIFVSDASGLGILQFDLDKMKVFIQQNDKQVEVFDILSVE